MFPRSIFGEPDRSSTLVISFIIVYYIFQFSVASTQLNSNGSCLAAKSSGE